MKKITTLSFLCATALLAGSLTFALKENTQENNIVEVSATSHPGNYDEYTYSGSYYDSAISSSDTEGMNGTLRQHLTTLIHPAQNTTPTYSGSGSSNTLAILCQSADEDPLNSNNMIYLYTRDSVTKNAAQSWNREHVWPQSLSNGKWGQSRAGSDLLHLRPTYNTTNSTRGNDMYGEVSKTYAQTYNNITYGYKNGGKFMPLDSVKGDVARICMYVWVAYFEEYGSSHPALTNVFESFNTLLSWHTSDRPDVMEGNRNDFCQTSCNQHNRNPFVDHPEYAWKIFGSQCSSSVLNACKDAYPESGSSSGYVTISQSSANLTVDDTLTLSATSSNSSSITWTNSNTNAVSISTGSTASGGSITVTPLAEGTATITASATIDNVVKSRTCTITVSNSGGSGGGQEKSTYTMLTSVSNIDSTAQYVLGIEGTGFHYAGTSSWGTIALPSAQTPLYYTLTKGSGSNFTARTTINSTTYYLTVPTSNTFTMSTSSTNIKLGTSTSDSNGHPSYAIANSNSNARHLRYNTAGGLRSYDGTTGTMAYFYKVNQEEPEPTLNSISVSTPPTKTVYNEGEYFNPAGLVITASYSNGNQTISYSGHESDFDFDPDLETVLDTSDTAISIYYGGISCEQAITVNEVVTLNSISISTPPTKTTYTEGESFDPTGLVITASYSNGNQTVTYSGHASDFSFNPDLEAELDTSDTSVTISYGGKSCNQPITVNEQVTLSSISVSGQTTQFTVGDTFVFGGTVTAHYSDSNTEDVTEDASFTGYNMSTTGNQTVTVTYSTVSTTYSITVSEAQQGDTDSVTIAQDHTFSPTLPVSKATSNTTSTLHSDLTSGIAFKEQGIYKDTINNNEYIMFVENKGFLYNTDSLGTIDSISITYSSGTSTSGKIGVYFGSTERNAYTTSANVTIKGVSQTDVFENSTEGNGFFQISTSNKNVQIVTIVIEYHESGSSQQGDPTLTGISLDTTNVTKIFEVNDTFSYTGLVVTAHYDISTYDEVVTNYTVDTPNMSTAGQKTVVVTYQGKTDSYEITVTSDAPTPVSGDGAVYDASEQGYTDKQDVTNIVIKQSCITGVFDISTGNNAPKYYDNGAAVRCYPGNMLTITSTKANIISITFTFGANDSTSNAIVPTTGTYSNGTWTNISMQNQVVFNFDGSSGNRRIAGITVNYYNATSFATEFLSGTGCDSTGKTAPTVNWSSMSTKYTTLLFTEDQNTLKNASANESGTTIEQAIARYNYIVNKYGYTNFMNRSTSGSYNNFTMVNEETNYTALIVVISIMSSISLIGFVLYKKKKKQ